MESTTLLTNNVIFESILLIIGLMMYLFSRGIIGNDIKWNETRSQFGTILRFGGMILMVIMGANLYLHFFG